MESEKERGRGEACGKTLVLERDMREKNLGKEMGGKRREILREKNSRRRDRNKRTRESGREKGKEGK